MNEDLKPSVRTLRQSMNSQKAFIISELIVLRYRDETFIYQSPAYKLLTNLAEQIHEVAQSWREQPDENHSRPDA